MRLLHLGFMSVFFDRRSNEWRDLVEPEGLATKRQLYWLNAHGLLATFGYGEYLKNILKNTYSATTA